MKRWLTTAVALFGTALMMAPDTADAQYRGRGVRGGYNPGYYNPGYGYGSGYYGGSPGIYIGSGGIGLTIGSGYSGSNWGNPYGYGNYYNPGGYGYSRYGYSNPTWGYNQPAYSYSSPRYTYPSTVYGPTTTSGYTPQGNAAIVDVRVADPNAEVIIDGATTEQRGTDRRFVSPPLELGHKYAYEVKVRWNDGTRMKEEKRTVSVTPGSVATVDFARDVRRGGEEPAEIPRTRPNND